MAGGLFGGGTGIISDPWLVEDALDVNAIRTKAANSYFKLTNNIDMSTDYPTTWVPLIHSGGVTLFNSYIDGTNYTISNLKAPLIDTIQSACSDLKVHVSIYELAYSGSGCGAFCRMAASALSVVFTNCHASGIIISGAHCVGGLVGNVTSSSSSTKLLQSCSSSTAVTSTYVTSNSYSDYLGAGGLVGCAYRLTGATGDLYYNIYDCICTGSVKGTFFVGGILGAHKYTSSTNNRGFVTIRRCIATGNISGLNYVGGIAGKDSSTNINGYLGVDACVALMASITRLSGVDIEFARICNPAYYSPFTANRALDTMVFVP